MISLDLIKIKTLEKDASWLQNSVHKFNSQLYTTMVEMSVTLDSLTLKRTVFISGAPKDFHENVDSLV